VYPHFGFLGEEFEENSFRKSLAGKSIAGGYKPLA